MLACSVLLGACGTDMVTSGRAARHHGATGTATASLARSAADAPPGQSALILSAWLAAERAFETAAQTSDPNEPALLATTTAPQIAWTVSLLARMSAAGEVGRGPMRFGSTVVDVVSSRLAMVHACGHDDELVVWAATGRPVPGVAGEFENEEIVAAMEWTSAGWKLADQTVQQAPCE